MIDSVRAFRWCALLGGCVLALAPMARGPLAADTGVVLRRLPAATPAGMARAVTVERGALVHTALLLPLDRDGTLRGAGDARGQARQVLDDLAEALRAARTGLDHLARLHVYVADASVTPAVEAVIAARFPDARPALTLVESAMPHAGVLVAMDAVAATAAPTAKAPSRLVVAGLRARPDGGAHVAVQPEGSFVIVSGRAAPGEFEPAVRETMAQLRADLEGVGLGWADVVHVKSFLGDISRADDLQRLVAASFDGVAPPQVVTEWHGTSVPAEIEVVAAAPRTPSGPARVEYVEPISSRFSRLVRVTGGRPVYVSGLMSEAADPAQQVREMFETLRQVVTEAGSDLRHLAKATYYVSDRGADEAINAVRPSVYDAARPPAASKISVRGVGRQGRGSTIDMIAITTAP